MNYTWNLAIALAVVGGCLTFPSPLAATSVGEDLYKSKCAMCHGPDGAGGTPMGKALKLRDLRSADVQQQSDEELNRIITRGKGKMPAFDGKLKKEQVGEVVAYIRTLSRSK
jgi:mono/diheme cytochrome c family protein